MIQYRRLEGIIQYMSLWPKAWQSVALEGNPFVVLDNKLHVATKDLQRGSDVGSGRYDFNFP